MNRNTIEAGLSYWRLVRFIGLYGLLVTILFQVLPDTASRLQVEYEALAVESRLTIVVLLAASSIAGLIHTVRSRNRLSAGLPVRSLP